MTIKKLNEIYKEIEDNDFYDIIDLNVKTFNITILMNLLSYSNIRHFININDIINRGNLKTLIMLFYSKYPDTKENIENVNTILRNQMATNYLVNTLDIENSLKILNTQSLSNDIFEKAIKIILKEENYFNIKNLNENTFNYVYFKDALNYLNVRNYLNAHFVTNAITVNCGVQKELVEDVIIKTIVDSMDRFRLKCIICRLYDVYSDIHFQPTERNLSKLNYILNNATALFKFEECYPFEECFDATKENILLFEDRINRVFNDLKEMNLIVLHLDFVFSYDIELLNRIKKEVKKLNKIKRIKRAFKNGR